MESEAIELCEKEITESIYIALWKVWQITNQLLMMGLLRRFTKHFGMELLIYFTNLEKHGKTKNKKRIERFTKASCHKVNWEKWIEINDI